MRKKGSLLLAAKLQSVSCEKMTNKTVETAERRVTGGERNSDQGCSDVETAKMAFQEILDEIPAFRRFVAAGRKRARESGDGDGVAKAMNAERNLPILPLLNA